jgi:hypothetical protein
LTSAGIVLAEQARSDATSASHETVAGFA